MLNVRDFGAVGDGVTDDRRAIQAAIDAAVAQRAGGIRVPAGTYRVSRATVPGGRWSLDLRGVSDFTVTGEGPASVVRLVDSQAATGDWHVFVLRDGCHRVTFTDLTVDGNRTGLTEPDEQSHGIEVEPGTEDLVIDRCILRECFGDGVRLLGAPGANVRRVRIQNSLLQRNKRSGLGVQRALEQIVVEGCVFHDTISDQTIDFEPSGVDGPADFLIHGCVIVHTNPTPAITLSGISGPDPSVRVKLADCVVVGGQVFCTDVAQLTIQGNTIVVPETAAGGHRVPVHVQRGGDAVLITDNLLISESPQTHAAITISEVNQRQVSRARIDGNLCFARGGVGIECVSSDDATISGNLVVATGACTAGILVRSETSPMDGIAVRDNDVTVAGAGAWETGILFAARPTQPVGGLLMTGNAIRGARDGLRFVGNGFRATPVCALNRMDPAVLAPLVGLESLPERAVMVSGATSHGSATLGAGRTLVGRGDPNGRVTGDVGDLFQRLDGGAGSTLYVKEAGAAGTAGWNAK